VKLERHFSRTEQKLRGENIALRRQLGEEMAKLASELDPARTAEIQARLSEIHKQYADLITQLKLRDPAYATFQHLADNIAPPAQIASFTLTRDFDFPIIQVSAR